MRRAAWLSALLLLGCDTLERSLDGTAAPLREPELPNCSKVLTCCANLSRDRVLGPYVADSCETVVGPTDLAIDNYQAAKLRIETNASISAESKAELTAELRETTQASLEPACGCLVAETVGNISLDGYLSPLDCELVAGARGLGEGQQCSDVTGNVLDPE